jgi:uncharacterized protein YbaR (Trm112 family)
MDAHYLNLLCDPETHEALELRADGLVNIRSGMRYALRDGIPDFLGTVSGQNKKYQEFYDRIVRFYDLADRPYRWLKGKRDFRRELIVAATMISRMIGTSVFSGRTEFSVTTAYRFPQKRFDHLRGCGSKDCMVIRGEFTGRNSLRPVAGLIEQVLNSFHFQMLQRGSYAP